ncbi:putative lipoprotein [Leptospira wolbachii serovar Codice str. CDC]|uniref:Lipoprotein n=1 Tax=Leptospira wolbachii serovar Codice str. CDC TaxID=1218599 RepID=R9A7M1_9LEPT|nr:lipoprotein [Leptospira wolbachii]EOQ96235.1 putative lipoprotein [Leptospira wolbachii serovar Codice str. CDC]
MKKTILFLSLFILGCASDYNKIIKATESAYYGQDYDSAIPKIRELYEGSSTKDKLLFLMEAGMIFHTKGDYVTSNKVFKEAEDLADNIRVSMMRSGLSFVLSDNESNYTGEDFERVMIKFYIANNYLLQGDTANAKIYFRRLDFELKEMRFMAAEYRQNNAARLIDAYVSEKLGRYNDARVQYKNMEQLVGKSQNLIADRYLLAVREGDSGDQAKYAAGRSSIQAYNSSMQRTSPENEKLSEVIIIHEAGKSAIKMSRGKLMEDEYFAVALRGAVEVGLYSKGAGASLTGAIAALSIAENPIPIYKERDPNGSLPKKYFINGVDVGYSDIMNNYSETAMNNFNENYKTLITKNLTSLSLKIVAAVIASEAMARAIESSGKSKNNDLVSGLIRVAAGAAAGLAVSQTIAPDLRCWRTIPANFQVKRIFLAPGEYDFKVESPGSIVTAAPKKLLVEAGKPLFVSVRSYSN